MANVTERQIVQEGWRNVTVKFTGTIDSADVVEAPALSLGDMLNNDKGGTLWGFRVDRVQWSLGEGLLLGLEWNSADPQQIVELAGHDDIDACHAGGFIPDRLLAGYDGAINLRTRAYAPGTASNFTVVMNLVKLYL